MTHAKDQQFTEPREPKPLWQMRDWEAEYSEWLDWREREHGEAELCHDPA